MKEEHIFIKLLIEDIEKNNIHFEFNYTSINELIEKYIFRNYVFTKDDYKKTLFEIHLLPLPTNEEIIKVNDTIDKISNIKQIKPTLKQKIKRLLSD